MPDIQNILIIYNPVSGSFLRKTNDQQYINNFFDKKNIKYTFLHTKPDDTQEIKNHLSKNYDRVLVAGGDGTVREVAHLLIKNKNKTPLGILPQGTSNIFALALGIPFPLRMSLNYFYKSTPIDLDAGLVNNEKYFFISCGVGYDAKFLKATSRLLKKFLGPLAYFIIAFKESYNDHQIKGHLTIDNQCRAIDFSSLVVFNVRSMLSRRKYIIYKVHPGVLDVLIAKSITMPNALKLTHKLLRRNKPIYKDVELIQTKKLKFVAEKSVPFEMDGEIFTSQELDIEIIPQAIKIIGHK